MFPFIRFNISCFLNMDRNQIYKSRRRARLPLRARAGRSAPAEGRVRPRRRRRQDDPRRGRAAAPVPRDVLGRPRRRRVRRRIGGKAAPQGAGRRVGEGGRGPRTGARGGAARDLRVPDTLDGPEPRCY